MSLGIKIKLVQTEGEMRVPPKCMELLIAYAEHKKTCIECSSAYATKQLTNCKTGYNLIKELSNQPEVEPF